MNILQILKLTNEILNQHQIDYALIGGLALGVYGFERFTNLFEIEWGASQPAKLYLD